MNPYIADKLPLKDLDYQMLFGLVGEANAELARYDGLLQGGPKGFSQPGRRTYSAVIRFVAYNFVMSGNDHFCGA